MKNSKIALILLLTVVMISLLMSNTLTVSGEEDSTKEYTLGQIRKIAQYHLDTFYLTEQKEKEVEYKVGSEYINVYNEYNELYAYIVAINEKASNTEIGYVMVGSNNKSPVILEACIGETLVTNLKKDKNKNLVYIAPLKLATKNNNKYKDIRTDKEVKPISKEFKEKRSKKTSKELVDKNKKKWGIVEKTILNSSSNIDIKYNISSYIPPTVYQVTDEQNFVRIYSGYNSYPDSNDGGDNPYTNSAYGGDQDWYENSYNVSIGCGPVAAANITAYWARKNNNYADLYNQTDLSYAYFYKSYFKNHMEDIYDYFNPSAFGIPSVSLFKSKMIGYMNNTLGYSLTSGNVYANTYSNFVSGITTGLSYEAPIAMLFLTPDSGIGEPDLSLHWITITKYFKDNNIDTEYFACSSWGYRYSLGLYGYWNGYFIDGGVYYR